MPIYDKTDYNVNPYYDDWAINGTEYLRTLFRPGYAVQARELTQIQTVLQNQVGRFASHIFEDGSRIYGPAGADQKCDWVRIEPNIFVTGTVTGAVNHEDFQNRILYSDSEGGAFGRVVHTITGTDLDPYSLLFFQYLDGSNTFKADDQIYVTGGSYIEGVFDSDSQGRIDALVKSATGDNIQIPPTSTHENATGNTATVISVDNSIYYVDGYFVNASQQTDVLYHSITGERLFNNPSSIVGFDIKREFVSSDADSTLLDPARGSSNYAAPGSDRLKYTLNLSNINYSPSAGSTGLSKNDFIEIMRVENGYIIKNQQYPVYSQLADELARRTYDESGNYTVRPYPVVVKEHLLSGDNGGVYTVAQGGVDTDLAVGLEAGKAYVFGFEHENLVTEYVACDKGRTSDHIRNYDEVAIDFSVGNYVRVSGGVNTKNHHIPDIESGTLHRMHGPIFRYVLNGLATVANIFQVGETVVATNGATGTVLAWSPDYVSTGSSTLTITSHGFDDVEFPAPAADTAITGQTSAAAYSITSATLENGQLTGAHDVGIGTCRIKQIGRYDDDEDKLHLYDIRMRGALPHDLITGDTTDTTSPFAAVRVISVVSGNAGLQAAYHISTEGKPNGITKLHEKNKNALLYPVPYGSVVKDIEELTYFVQQGVTKNTSNVGTNVYWDSSINLAGCTWYPGSNTSEISVSDIKEHYKLVDPMSGIQYDLTSAGITGKIDTSGVHIRFDGLDSLGITTSSSLQLIGTVKVNDSSATIKKTKTLTHVEGAFLTGGLLTGPGWNEEYHGVVTLPHADVTNITGFDVIVNESGGIYTYENILDKMVFDNGQTDSFYNHASLTLKRNATYDYNGNPIPRGITGIARYYYYNHSAGSNLITSDAAGAGVFLADVDDGGSYLSGYSNIPTYTSKSSGKVYDLRDVIDFRPLRTYTGGGTDDSVTGGTTNTWIPKHGTLGEISYNHYLPRVDKVVLTRDRKFDIIRGIPQEDAPIPPDRDDSMTLYVNKIPAYTFSPNDVDTRYVENKRYTMRDIGKIDKRVDRLEYYSTLSLLEKETDALKITDANGLTIFKNGILVDPFKGHSVGDVNNSDYTCSIDFENQELRPSFETRVVKLVHDWEELTGESVANSEGNLWTLSYTETTAIEQPMASTTLSVNPFHTIQWRGEMRCTPPSDNWYDTSTKPFVQVNTEGENDAWVQKDNPFGTQWNDWELIWGGQENKPTEDSVGWASTQQGKITREILTSGKIKTSKGIVSRKIPESITKTLGNKTLNVSVVPYMRAIDIDGTCRGMKPSTTVHAFFDGTNVDDRTMPLIVPVNLAGTGTFSLQTNGTEAGTIMECTAGANIGSTAEVASWVLNADGQTGIFTFKNVTGLFSQGDTIRIKSCGPNNAGCNINHTVVVGILTYATDANGEFQFHMSLEGGKYRTGERQIRITDVSDNNISLANTAADATFSTNGYIFSKGESTRTPVFVRPNVNTEAILTDPISRGNQAKTKADTIWRDPIAQTFLVDPITNPNGLFVSSIDLWFASIDGSLPVTVEIRPTVNGYPSAGEIIPLAVKTKSPHNVNVLGANAPPDPNNSESYTRFTFDNPIYLKPGEYAFTVISNSGDYHVYTGVVGQYRVDSERNTNADLIANQPYAGVLFESQNSSTWSADQSADIMFRINRCDFASSADVQFMNTPYASSPIGSQYVNCDVVRLMADYLEFSQTTATFQLQISNNLSSQTFSSSDAIIVKPNTNIELEKTKKINEVWSDSSTTTDKTAIVRVGLSTQDSRVSPVIDLTRFDLVAVENLINNNVDTNPENPGWNGELNASAGMPGITGTHYVAGATGGSGVCRYITRRVQLEDGFESNKINVYMDAYRPDGSTIQAFMKYATPEHEGEFDDIGYIQLSEVTPTTYSDELKEVRFESVTGDIPEQFDRFAIKIVLSASNNAKVPRVKDLRAIALPE